MLLLGEVRTCMLHNSSALAAAAVGRLLGLVPGESPTQSHRPVSLAASPAQVVGVDCALPSSSGARYRGVGTVAARVVLTGGHVLQGSAHTRIEPGVDHRLPWSHYLARPGVVESVGRYRPTDVAAGFLATHSPEDTLDVGAVTERLISLVQSSAELDHRIPLRARRTRLRWAATIAQSGECDGTGELTIHDEVVRTLRLSICEDDIAEALGFCENLALHDWVLTTLLNLVERSGLGSAPGADAIVAVRPAIDHLLHLWMPGAHVGESMLPLWESLEERPGFSRQWHATVNRIRDQLAVNAVTAWHRS